MTVMAFLHWQVSESLYIIAIDAFNSNGDPQPDDSILKVGWNATSAASSTGVGLYLVIFLLITGFRRYPAGIPLAASSSVAISAACHRAPDEDGNMVLRPLQFGIRMIEKGTANDRSDILIGFSAKPVQRLTKDQIMALGSEYKAPSHLPAGSHGLRDVGYAELSGPPMHQLPTNASALHGPILSQQWNGAVERTSAGYGG